MPDIYKKKFHKLFRQTSDYLQRSQQKSESISVLHLGLEGK